MLHYNVYTSSAAYCRQKTFPSHQKINKKWKSQHDGIGQCLSYLQAEANLDCSILQSQILLRKTSGVWKNVSFALWQQQCIQWLTCSAISASVEFLVLASCRFSSLSVIEIKQSTSTKGCNTICAQYFMPILSCMFCSSEDGLVTLLVLPIIHKLSFTDATHFLCAIIHTYIQSFHCSSTICPGPPR